MLKQEIIEIRNHSSRKYVEYLSQSFSKTWKVSHDELKNINNKNDFILSKLALIHPQHYYSLFPQNIQLSKVEDYFNLKIEKIQGKRSFSYRMTNEKCQSETLWGYSCPLTTETLASDHLFPFSFGGPTNNAINRKTLCRWHNMIKSNDIHCYPWEILFEQYEYYQNGNRLHWIDEQLTKILKEFNL